MTSDQLTKRIVQAFVAFVVALVFAGLAYLILAAPVRAQGWPHSEFAAKPRENVVRRHVHKRPPADPSCMPPVSVVGDQAPTVAGAHAQSEKAWQQEVRFRHGERYADAENAREITYQCVSSSIRNIANRATEAIGINTQAKRCQMQATPCAAPRIGEGRK